jgi:glycerophosphoryl diester phosphodiesterase
MRQVVKGQANMLNLKDCRSIEERKPLLVAHRGGVVSQDTPENSLAAIRLASHYDYDMVELDVREAKDHVPMLFHGLGWSDHLYVDCGIDKRLEELTSDELSRITYRMSTQTIAKLSEALMICSDLDLGVMLDIKVTMPSNDFSTIFLIP